MTIASKQEENEQGNKEEGDDDCDDVGESSLAASDKWLCATISSIHSIRSDQRNNKPPEKNKKDQIENKNAMQMQPISTANVVVTMNCHSVAQEVTEQVDGKMHDDDADNSRDDSFSIDNHWNDVDATYDMLLEQRNARLEQYHREAVVAGSTEASRSPPSFLQSSSLPTHHPAASSSSQRPSSPTTNAQTQQHSQLPDQQQDPQANVATRSDNAAKRAMDDDDDYYYVDATYYQLVAQRLQRLKQRRETQSFGSVVAVRSLSSAFTGSLTEKVKLEEKQEAKQQQASRVPYDIDELVQSSCGNCRMLYDDDDEEEEADENDSSHNCEVQRCKIKEAMDIVSTKGSPASSIQSAPRAPTEHREDHYYDRDTNDFCANGTSSIAVPVSTSTADPLVNSCDKVAELEDEQEIGVGSELGMDEWDPKKNDDDDDKNEDYDDYLDDERTLWTLCGAPDSKYSTYHIHVDPQQQDRAIEIHLFTAARPHMRAFHCAWLSFFVAFFSWFAMTPLLSEVQRSLHLSREQIWTSSVFAVTSSTVTRILTGPINDKYGARLVMGITLVVAAIPTALSGWLIRDAKSLYLVRFFIGIGGSSFVSCEFWSASMFTREVAGTASALTAGWGNLGGGIAQLVMGSLLFPLFKIIYSAGEITSDCYDRSAAAVAAATNGSSKGNPFDAQIVGADPGAIALLYSRPCDMAWRTSMAFPAFLSLVTAYCILRYSDDTPKGNILKRRRENHVPPVFAAKNLLTGIQNRNTLLLSMQYGCCFGVEITMIQAAALYFQTEFGQSTESAAAIASVFGWMNLFARGIGGFCSDMANARAGMKGRLCCQAMLLSAAGCLVIAFAYSRTLAQAIGVMIVFSTLVQAAEGSTFGIVPYVNPQVTGTITGLVGAGGNIGGVVFALIFRARSDRSAFFFMGCAVAVSATWTIFINIVGHRSLLWGQDAAEIVIHRQKAKLPEVISFEITAN